MRKATVVACSALLMLPLLAGAAVPYYVDDAGGLSGAEARAYGLNAGGTVVGPAKTADDHWHAYLADDGVAMDLAALPPMESWANGINDDQQVVGYAAFTEGYAHAFRWTDANENGLADPGELIDLGTLSGTTSAATAINASGQVAGYSQKIISVVQLEHAFRWTDTNLNNQADAGEMVDLGTLDGQPSSTSYAYGINDAGDVVGKSKVSIHEHAFYWRDTNGNNAVDAGEMADLGTLGGTESAAYGVNDAGQVVGYATNGSGEGRAFRWTDTNGNGQVDGGELIDLGTLGTTSAAYAVNAAGDVVGFSLVDESGTPTPHAFLYQGGQMMDLADLIEPGTLWELEEARAINDAGQVAGVGMLDGVESAFLMTPAIGGDATLDRKVTGADLAALATNWNVTSGATWFDGDFTGDGKVTGADLAALATNWNADLTAPASGGAVPEPTTMALLGATALVVVRRRRAR